jgi:serine/threonine kinase PknH
VTAQPPADWYPDPSGGPGLKYWDGQQWHLEIPAPAAPPTVEQSAPPTVPPAAQPGALAPVPPVGSPPPQRQMGLVIALVATIAFLVVGIAGVAGYFLLRSKHASQPPTAASATTAAPLTATALEGLLLTPDQVNALTNSSGMTVTETLTTLPDISATVSDQSCLPLFAEDSQTYGGSGWTDARIQALLGSSQQPGQKVLVNQGVILFPSAQAASSFVTGSAQRWAPCAGRQVSVSMPAGTPAVAVTVGSVSNSNGMLSTTMTQAMNGTTVNIERALTAVNNVIVDAFAISPIPLSGAAANLAQQIAAKVPTS